MEPSRWLPVRRWSEVFTSDRGTVTAEFAVVLPAVLIVLGVVISGIVLAAHRLTLVSLSGEIARLEARADEGASAQLLERVGPDIDVARDALGPLHCVTLTSHPARGILSGVGVSARSCAVRTGGAQ